MPWSGSSPNQQATRTDGISSGDNTWQQAAAAPRNIEADDHDAHDTDIKDMINACLKKDGGNTATADIPLGGFKFTNVDDASNSDEFATKGQLDTGLAGLLVVNPIGMISDFAGSVAPSGWLLCFG